MRRLLLAVTLMLTSLLTATAAQAVVLSDATSGVTAGVALAPGARASLPANWSALAPSGPCVDPAQTPDLAVGSGGLCLRGGSVLHKVEAYAVRWDRPSPDRAYWSTTLNIIHTFLGDVAAASGALSSPFALTGQYHDYSGGAGTAWLYGGGCSDLGNAGSTCTFPNEVANGPGTDYPVGASCQTGQPCTITDADIRGEVSAMVQNMALVGRTQPGYSPLVTVLTPPNVVVCLDSAHTLCSVNAPAGGSVCSYHSQLTAGGGSVSYVVQPWTVHTTCDETDIPPLPSPPPVLQVETDAGQRLVSPLSAGMIAATINPGVTNGWIAGNGSEMNDNGCGPGSVKADTVTVGARSYWLEREFNNAFAMVAEPWTYGCAPSVSFQPDFVAPSPINHGDVVAFDGSDTVATLLVPRAGYTWDFGDGSSATGPSVVHSYAKGGAYDVTLTTVDRGGHRLSVTHQVDVLPLPTAPGPGPGTTAPPAVLHARMQLLPQSFRSLLKSGVAVRVISNLKADGFVTLSIPASLARQAHLRAGRSSTVMIGRGTVSGIAAGSKVIHVRVPSGTVRSLSHLRHLTLTLRMTLVDSARAHQTIVAAGRY
jgi:hypothetical protein